MVVSGQVQGVNFRSMVKVRALTLGLVGSVQNESDGTVKIIAEGARTHIEALVRWLHEHPGGVRIETVSVHWSQARGSFTTFSIVS
ncbi:MAG: acylphosphatase [Candidatus Kerfeldbacteria bacterium]|nr:acylphosphatase [Candidatus Kerfeldbacteria bacterium]